MNQNDTYFLENSPLFSGKIRQVFNYSQDKLLIRTSDKISAFDFVFDDEVTTKGSLNHMRMPVRQADVLQRATPM